MDFKNSYADQGINKYSMDLDKTKNQSYICPPLRIVTLILSTSCVVVLKQEDETHIAG